MAPDHIDAEKIPHGVRAEPRPNVEPDDAEASGLPGRAMALLIAIAFALLAALVAWLMTGGVARLFER